MKQYKHLVLILISLNIAAAWIVFQKVEEPPIASGEADLRNTTPSVQQDTTTSIQLSIASQNPSGSKATSPPPLK